MRKKLSALMCLLFLTLVSCGEEQTPTHLPPSPLDKDIENQFRNMEFSLTPVSKEGCTLSALTLTNTTDYPFYLIDAGFSEKKTPTKKLYAKQKARFQAAMGDNFSSQKYDAIQEEELSTSSACPPEPEEGLKQSCAFAASSQKSELKN